MDLLQWVNDSTFSSWIRESGSLWAYPAFITLHTAGLALLVGLSTVADVMILTSVPGSTMAPISGLFGYMWVAFYVNAVTGLVLIAADATTMVVNPVMWVKLGFVLVAVVLTRQIQVRIFTSQFAQDPRPAGPGGKLMAAVCLFCWFAAIATGRLTVYIGPRAGLVG